MSWSSLATQFCLELAFGVLVALAFVRAAPVGAFFYRLMGTAVLLPLAFAVFMPVKVQGRSWTEPAVLATGLALLAYPLFSGPARGSRWSAGLFVGIFASAAALFLGLLGEGVVELAGWGGALQLAVAGLSTLATGAVAGSVGLAMVLGHWYLTVPKLETRHLARLNRVTVVAMFCSLVLLGVTCLTFRETLDAAETPLLGSWGLFYMGTRVSVGLLLPLVFAWMTADSLRFQNTRSATGILYASTVLVLIGTAAALSLQDSYGVPL